MINLKAISLISVCVVLVSLNSESHAQFAGCPEHDLSCAFDSGGCKGLGDPTCQPEYNEGEQSWSEPTPDPRKLQINTPTPEIVAREGPIIIVNGKFKIKIEVIE